MHSNTSNKDAKENLKPNLALYGAAASAYFSDILLWNFLFPYAVVLGTSFNQMGLIRSARNLFQNILQIGWSEFSERFGKRILIAIGYFSSGCLIIALLLSRDPLQLLILVVVQSILWSAAPPAWSSIIADYTSLKTRGRIIGKIGAVTRFSGVIAALIVVSVTYFQPGEMTVFSFTVPFALAATAAMLCASLIGFAKEAKVKRAIHGISGIVSPLLDRNFLIFLFANGFYWFTMTFAWPLYPYVSVNVVHITVWQIALISASSDFLTSITQPKFGSIVDRFGRKPILIVSQAALSLYPLLYAFATHWLHLFAINVLLSIPMSASNVSFSAYIMDSAPPGLRANYAASANMIVGIAAFLGSLAGGTLTSYLSTIVGAERALFLGLILSSFLRLASALGFLFIKETLLKRKGN